MPPNIIFFTTDQQRYDTINALGYPYMQTPTLDQLVNEGTAFTQMYITAPSCVPARASFYSGQYPHHIEVYHNASPWTPRWIPLFQQAGYHTVNVGKFHVVPMDDPAGFDQRFVVENKDRPLKLNHPHGGFYDEWDKFLNNHGVKKPSRESYRATYPGYETALGAYEWQLEEKYHPDVFVGTMAKWFVEQRESESPLFMVVGFPGPHPPYDPPERYISKYADVDIPLPHVTEEELAGQPPPQHAYRQAMIHENHDAVHWQEHPTDEQLQRLRRYYAANVTLIDDQIAGILEVLEQKGYLEDAIVVFMSDHGDCLGDHGHIQKWTMYDEVLRVPVVIHAPDYLPQGKQVNALLQQFDIIPMIFELAGLDVPQDHQAISAMDVICDGTIGREAVFAEHSADNLLREVDCITMIRTTEWKLVYYLNQPWGELYDLQADPAEINNLWEKPEHQTIKYALIEQLLTWQISQRLV